MFLLLFETASFYPLRDIPLCPPSKGESFLPLFEEGLGRCFLRQVEGHGGAVPLRNYFMSTSMM